MRIWRWRFMLFRKREKLMFFGPGLMLAITAAGEFGIVEATEIGAQYHLQLLWVVMIALFFKYAFVTGVARYTLATGQTVFDGLGKVPGPNHWAQYLLFLAFIIDMIVLGAMVQFVSVYLSYLLPGTYWTWIVCLIVMIIVTLIIRTRSYGKLEPIVAVVVLIVIFAVYVSISDFTFTMGTFSEGFKFGIPEHSELAILAIIGVCGSALNIMLYSKWLNDYIEENKVDVVHDRSTFRKYMKSIRLDIIIGFVLVFVFTVGFMLLGYASFEMSLVQYDEHITIDNLIAHTMVLLSALPYGKYILPALIIIVFVAAATISLESRIGVIGKTICQIRSENGKETDIRKLYFIIFWAFFVIVFVTASFFNPISMVTFSSAACALFFGVFCLLIIYLNRRLPEYAQGTRAWMVTVALGSLLSVVITLRIEGTIMEFGAPMFSNMLVAVFAVFLIMCTRTYKSTVIGKTSIFSKFWIVIMFGIVSMWGTAGGVEFMSGTEYAIVINFRDMAVIIAGFIGGPWVGMGAGILGAVYRMSVGGPLAIPCGVATIILGFLAGYLSRRWQGRIGFKRAIWTVAGLQFLHLAVIVPIVGLIVGVGGDALLETFVTSIMPMIFVNVCGVLAFMYLARFTETFQGVNERTTLEDIKSDIKGFFFESEDD